MSDLLPEAIQAEILSRLPVKSLLSCKCTCKQWCSLIRDPDFIKNHLDRGIQTNNRRLLVNYGSLAKQVNPPHRYCTSGFASIPLTSSPFLPHDGYVSVDYPFQYCVKGLDWVKILGSSNGLICLRIHRYANNYICIWNPSTREYKQVELSVRSPVFHKAVHGFGYDGVKDDYRLVRIDDIEEAGQFNIHVYTLGSDSWSNKRKTPYYFPFRFRCDGLLFNGALHWFGAVKRSSVEVILSFNLSNEATVEIPLPESPMPQPRAEGLHTNVGVLENCLCLVYNDVVWRNFDVWVMKDYGVNESWTKQFTIQDTQTDTDGVLWMPICVFKNGDILANNTMVSVICNPEEVAGLRKMCISCSDGYLEVLESASYVESLVSLNTGTYITVEKVSNAETHTTSEKKTRKGKRLLEYIKKLKVLLRPW